MKVVCVVKEWRNIKRKSGPHTCPKENSIYTVIDTCMITGDPCYALKEIPLLQNGSDQWWIASSFIPLDSYKEKELKEELAEILQ